MLRLLIGVDGSDDSLRAVRHADELARRGLAIEAILCHVQPPVLSGEIGVVAPIENAELRNRAAAEAALASAQAVLSGSPLKSTPHWVTGDAATELARAAHAWNCDTIVVGRRGLGGIAGALLGSVSRAVPRWAEVPVTVVP